MTALPEAYLDAMPIDHLDFTPSCHVHRRTREDVCDQPADWWAILSHHCKPDTTIEALWCTPHHDQIIAGTPHLCPTCRQPINLNPLIIRTERIR